MRASGQVRIRESHCVRARYEKSGCSLCADACPHDAISFSPGPVIDMALCTDCTACVAACRTAALEAPTVLFWETLRALAAVPAPVLACELAVDVEGHATVPCIGFLAPEHVVAMAVFLPDGVTFNLTACAECENAPVIEQVVETVERLRDTMPEHLAAKVSLARSVDDLGFEHQETDRRGFFSAIGDMVRTQTMKVLAESRDTDVGKTPFWEKIVPRERMIFERVAGALGEAEDADGLTAVCALLGYSAEVDGTCQLCFGCVGMCPNGALDSIEQEIKVEYDTEYHEELQFLASRCGGCKVCEEFCLSRSIAILPGCTPEDALEWRQVAGDTAGQGSA